FLINPQNVLINPSKSSNYRTKSSNKTQTTVTSPNISRKLSLKPYLHQNFKPRFRILRNTSQNCATPHQQKSARTDHASTSFIIRLPRQHLQPFHDPLSTRYKPSSPK